MITADDPKVDLWPYLITFHRFRWVDLQIQSLRHLKVAADVRARLGALPVTLESSYWEIFQQIKDSGEHAFKLATFTFQWLLYARRRISIEGFSVLASVALAPESSDPFTTEEILDVCANLVVDRSTVLEFAHLSVREFFERLENRGVDSYLAAQGHSAIAQACVLYFHLALKENKGYELKDEVLAYYDRQVSSKSVEGDREGDEDDTIKGGEDLSQFSVDVEEEDNAPTDDISAASEVARIWGRREIVLEMREGRDGLFAVLSSDIQPGVPSVYAACELVYHINEAGESRKTSPLADLLKSFMLEKADPGNGLYKVARPFHAWCAILQLDGQWSIEREGHLDRASIAPASPIWLSCYFNWLELVEYLYTHPYPGINGGREMPYLGGWKQPNLWEQPSKFSPTGYAIMTKNHELINLLSYLEADSSWASIAGTSFEPLVLAARWNDTELISLLAQRDYGGQKVAQRAFWAASKEGHCGPMKLLLDLGLITVDVVEASDLVTPCAEGHADVVSLLLERGLVVENGDAMLYRAALNQHANVVDVLLQNKVGLRGATNALEIAISQGDSKSAELLIGAGARKDGAAVIRAIRSDTPRAALRLIEAGFDIKGRYLEGRRTALHFAVEKGQLEVVKALLDGAADVNARDRHGSTPLHVAATRGHGDCARLLLSRGADTLAQDGQGRIPLDVAEDQNQAAMEAVIRQDMEEMVARLQAVKGSDNGSRVEN